MATLAGAAPGGAAESVVAHLPLRTSVRTKSPLPEWPPPGLRLHVAAQGDDAGNGSADRPFATLERARDEIRALRQKGGLPPGGAEVVVHGGQYTVTRTFALTESDSGSEACPIVFRAARGEKPVFGGGTRLTGWRVLSEPDGYPQIQAEARSKIWITELRACGITNLLPLKLGGFASGSGFRTFSAHELFFNDRAMCLARGPNEGFLRIKDVAVKDGTKGYDRQGSKTGKFFYEGDRANRWAGEPDLLLYGYWFWDWADSYERVASIDPEQRLITLAQPWHNYGFSVGAPFYAVNALSELDAPEEWYLDRAHGRILFYAPTDPRQANVALSRFDAPMVTLANVSSVSFIGLTWELGSADAIHLKGGERSLLAGCTVRHFAGNGVEIDGGRRHAIVSCDIHSLGRGGTIVRGGNRKTLEPGGHLIENCDISDLSRIDHTYTPAVILDGVGNRVAHNRLHDIRSSALRMEGNDHTVEYNEVYSVVTESDDQGGADMWGNPTFRGNVYRYNYWHHIGNWRDQGEQPKCGQAGIRLDDAICGTLIRGNVFERCSAGKAGFGGVQIHGGKDNVLENNLFVDCAAAVSFSPWSDERWRGFVKGALDAAEIDRDLYVRRYPELARLAEDANVNHVRTNLAWRCGELFRRAPKALDATGNAVLEETEFHWNPSKFDLTRAGFERIPIEEIGLYQDSFRQRDQGER